MTPVQVCSICTGAIVGFGNDAQPICDGCCCDRCHAERVVPERGDVCWKAMPSAKATAGPCNDLRPRAAIPNNYRNRDTPANGARWAGWRAATTAYLPPTKRRPALSPRTVGSGRLARRLLPKDWSDQSAASAWPIWSHRRARAACDRVFSHRTNKQDRRPARRARKPSAQSRVFPAAGRCSHAR